MTSDELCLMLERSVRGVGTEEEIQRSIEKLFKKNAVAYQREVRLDKASRIDFMVEAIGVEVKVGGGISAVIRQLHRYAEFASVSELVLVSTKTSLARVPVELNGKRVRVALLMGGIF